MRKFVISEELLTATLNYLNTKPRCEVNNLASAIEGSAVEYEAYKANETEEQKINVERAAALKSETEKKIIDEDIAKQDTVEGENKSEEVV